MKRLCVLALSFVVSCTNTQPATQSGSLEDEGDWMTATVMGARGLFTSPNQIAGAPQGSAVVAENMVVVRPGVYETRRGYEGLASFFPEGAAQSLTEYKGTLIGWGGTTLARFDEIGNAWIPYAGDNAAPVLGTVTTIVNANGSATPVVATTGAYIPPELGTITLTVTNGGTDFTWDAGNGDGNQQGQAILPGNAPVTLYLYGPPSTPGPIGITVVFGDADPYADGDSWSFTVSGGTAGVYAAPLGPLKAGDGTLLTGKVMFHETGGCLYFTTSRGVYRLEEPTGTPQLSGAPQGLPSTGVLTGTSGFLMDGFSVAYRETWSKRTPEGRIIEGPPSGRVTVFNTVGGGATRNVSRTIYIPPDVTPDMFVRVWRTESFPNALGPGEDYAQVHEKALSDMPAGATTYTFTDITPDAIRGDAAYFSASLGDGLVSSKFRPPLSTDVTTFRDSTVFIGATGFEAVQMTMIGVTAFQGTDDDGLVFIFADGSREKYTSTFSTSPGPSSFTVFTDGTPTQNVVRTVNSLVRQISIRSGGRLRAFYISDDNGTPGSFQVEARALDEARFTVRALFTTVPWVPTLKIEADVLFESRTSNQVRVSNAAPHGLSIGQVITVSNSSQPTVYPNGDKTVSSTIDALTYTYTDPGPNGSISATGTVVSNTVDLTTERQGGSSFVAWSPLGEPDAVPVLQYVRVGKDENPVLGAMLLGNSLYLRKADGLYRLSGDVPATFALDQVDTTVSFIAPWAAFALGGSAYALTTEGLKTWSETGKPQPASVPVEAEIRDLIVQNRDAVDRYAFAVNYDSDRTMFLWMPQTDNQERADFAYRFNYLTDSWTTETTDALSAVVSPSKDRLFIGQPVDEGIGFATVLLERKDRLATDYADADGEPILSRLVYSPQLGSDPSLGKHFNRMKYHLDPDAPVPTTVDVTFTSDWTPETGSLTIPGMLVRGRTLETLVTPNNRRGTRLYVGIEHATPNEKLSILGYTVSFYEHAIGTL